MAKKIERAGSLFLAVLFFISSFGLSGLVIWQIHQDNKAQKAAIPKEVQDQLNAQKAQQNAANQANNQPQEGKLKGTKLANFTPLASVTDLQKIDTVVGTGAEVKAGDTVTVHYTGALVKDGTIFESSKDSGTPATFGLDQVIKGWTQGLPGMKVGGTRRLIIPAALAYGAQATGSIPANSDLVFDVELIKIGQ
jgi:FKBP-type peptidyl-prolyl cis-trans isomerase FkpA